MELEYLAIVKSKVNNKPVPTSRARVRKKFGAFPKTAAIYCANTTVVLSDIELTTK